MKERIQKVLANIGVDSRRNVEKMVLEGRITVNGKIVRSLPVLVDTQSDQITVDGEKIKFKRAAGGPGKDQSAAGDRVYFMLNKPKGVYSTNLAQGTQMRAIDLLPPKLAIRLYPVGRLDAMSKGLLLLTNDGELTHWLTHPSFGVHKTFRVTVDGVLNEEEIDSLEKGVWMPDRIGRPMKTAPAEVKVLKVVDDRSVLDITFRAGKNSEVRRLFARIGHKVRDVIRTELGPLELGTLKVGSFRELTPKEVRTLHKLMKQNPAPREKRPPHGRPQQKPDDNSSETEDGLEDTEE